MCSWENGDRLFCNINIIVNTLFINNAHKFGLSQLYQIRGRIGRSEKSSYAYFLLPKNSRINELSEDRLNAIVNTSNFRSGYDLSLIHI